MVSALVTAVVLLVAPPSVPDVKRVTLGNGMRWLLVPRPGAPRTSGVITVAAGGVDEEMGITGVAHLLEHLAFAGTPFVGSKRGWRVEEPFHDEAMQAADAYAALEKLSLSGTLEGGLLYTRLVTLENQWRTKSDSASYQRLLSSRDISSNASTAKHVTRYVSDLPAGQLQFWLTLEAQRFAAPVFRDFRVERSVVLQELKDRSSPLDRAYDQLYWTAFGASGHGWPTIGWEADVRALAPGDLDGFYARRYAPGNAVGCLVGDFDLQAVSRWLEDTFGAIPARSVEARHDVVLQPRTRARLEANSAELLLAFPMPPRTDSTWKPRMAAVQLVMGVTAVHGVVPTLAGPDLPAVRATVAFGPGDWGPHLAMLRLKLPAGRDAAGVERAFWEALQRYEPTAAELEVALAQLAFSHASETSTPLGLASVLSEAELMFGRWEVSWDVQRSAPTLAQVRAELAQMFRPEEAWVIELGPKR